mmetsp:Transcript_3817/g.14274  ORF Transcript_3817/g.14274 Transcript_3817/m.14274 type:complete len:246 (+) Transcript_3817:298-1035(+)
MVKQVGRELSAVAPDLWRHVGQLLETRLVDRRRRAPRAARHVAARRGITERWTNIAERRRRLNLSAPVDPVRVRFKHVALDVTTRRLSPKRRERRRHAQPAVAHRVRRRRVRRRRRRPLLWFVSLDHREVRVDRRATDGRTGRVIARDGTRDGTARRRRKTRKRRQTRRESRRGARAGGGGLRVRDRALRNLGDFHDVGQDQVAVARRREVDGVDDVRRLRFQDGGGVEVLLGRLGRRVLLLPPI